MKSETCFSTGKVCAACLVIVTILTATNFYKLWACDADPPAVHAVHAVHAANAADPADPAPDLDPPLPEEEVDPIQALDAKMVQQTQLLLELHQDMDEVNSNLTEIQVLLKDD